jgi:nucleotide-binding universal stress UspA family protein
MNSSPFRRILVGVDGSAGSERVVEVAISLAATLKAQIILLGVIAPLSAETQAEGVGLEEASNARAKLELQVQQASAVAHQRKVDAVTEIVQGEPETEIERKVAEASVDLIIVGHRHIGRVRRWLEGSTSEALIRSSQTSVLVVHDDHIE